MFAVRIISSQNLQFSMPEKFHVGCHTNPLIQTDLSFPNLCMLKKKKNFRTKTCDVSLHCIRLMPLLKIIPYTMKQGMCMHAHKHKHDNKHTLFPSPLSVSHTHFFHMPYPYFSSTEKESMSIRFRFHKLGFRITVR